MYTTRAYAVSVFVREKTNGVFMGGLLGHRSGFRALSQGTLGAQAPPTTMYYSWLSVERLVALQPEHTSPNKLLIPSNPAEVPTTSGHWQIKNAVWIFISNLSAVPRYAILRHGCAQALGNGRKRRGNQYQRHIPEYHPPRAIYTEDSKWFFCY